MLVSHKPMEAQRFKEISHLAHNYKDLIVICVPADGIEGAEPLDNEQIFDTYSQLGCFTPITEKMMVNERRPPVLQYLFDCSELAGKPLKSTWRGFLVDKQGHVRSICNDRPKQWLARLTQDIDTMLGERFSWDLALREARNSIDPNYWDEVVENRS